MANTQHFAASLRKSRPSSASCWNDSFAIQDGHFVGHDGFVVPNSFSEFHQRFPKYVENWVANRTRGTSSKAEAGDWTQELLMFLSALPLESVHRRSGKHDVIQTFSPERMHGANEARFRSFVNRCLNNKFNTLYRKWRQRPLSNPTNLTLAVEYEDGANDEFCYENSAFLRAQERRNRERDEQRLRLQEFVSCSETRIPGLRRLVGAFAETVSWEETANRIGQKHCGHIRRAARQLAMRTA